MAMIEPNLVELFKAMSDHLKHLTTLSSGFTLVMVAFLDKLFDQPEWQILVVISFITFTLAILFSAIAQVYWIAYIRDPQTYVDKKYSNVLSFTTFTAWGSFLIGVVGLIVFASKNFL